MRFETKAIKQAGAFLDSRPVSAPITLSTTFLRGADEAFTHGFRYSRLDNPNRRALELCMADLEGGDIAYAFSSGMAAIHAVFQSLRPGDHILIPDDVFFNTKMLVSEVFEDWGLKYTSVDMSDLDAVRMAMRINTRLVWIETPSNPQLKITDIRKIAEIAKSIGSMVAVDNTWPSPALQKPIELGADIVMHSTTKYLGGHSDVTGGCLILKEQNDFTHSIAKIQMLSGGIPSPFDCWLLSRGIKTLHLRMKAQSASAMTLASYLECNPGIEDVRYPGLEGHQRHDIATAQMQGGYGAMLSVLVKGRRQEALDIANKLKLFTKATSLGGVESLIEHRESVEGPDTTTPQNLLRMSVGLENVDDLIGDWAQALKSKDE